MLYRTPDGATVREHDVFDGSDRVRLAKPDLAGVFVTRGQACAAYVDNRHEAMRVVGLETGRGVLTVPFDGQVWADDCWFSASPDGAQFHIGWRISGSTWDVIARAQDASSVLREPHISLLYDNTFFGRLCVRWPRSKEDLPWDYRGEDPPALVRPAAGGRGFFLDLATGGRADLGEDFRSAGFYGAGRSLLVLNGGVLIRDRSGRLVTDAGVIIRDSAGDSVLLRRTATRTAR